MEIINIIKEFEGIIGALAGVLVTLAYTEYLKRKGKVVIYVVEKKWRFHTYEQRRSASREKSGNDLHDLTIEVSLDIYNSSEIPRVMRKIFLEFYVDKVHVHSILPKDESTGRLLGTMVVRDDFSINNIMPREIQRVKLSGYVGESDLHLISGVNHIRISYINEDDKKKHCDLFSGEIKPKSQKTDNQ